MAGGPRTAGSFCRASAFAAQVFLDSLRRSGGVSAHEVLVFGCIEEVAKDAADLLEMLLADWPNELVLFFLNKFLDCSEMCAFCTFHGEHRHRVGKHLRLVLWYVVKEHIDVGVGIGIE